MSSMDLTIYDFSTLLRKKITDFRSKLLDKRRIIDCYEQIKELLKEVSSFEEEINQRASLFSSNEMKEQLYNCIGYDYEFLKNIKNVLDYLLKFNRHSMHYEYEDNLLKSVCKKSNCKIDIHELQFKAIGSDIKVSLSDGVTIAKDGVEKYKNLISLLKKTEINENEMMKKIEQVNSPIPTKYKICEEQIEEVSILGSVIGKLEKTDYLADKQKVEELMKAHGRKTTVKINGTKYRIAKSEASKFKSAMIRIKKYESQLMLLDSDNDSQNICTLGKGQIKDGCVVSRAIERQVEYRGRIYVDGQQNPHSDTMLQRVGMEVQDTFSFLTKKTITEKHHNFFGIKKKRKTKSLHEMQKKIATTAVAVALSIVTAISSFSLLNSFKKDQGIDDIDDSTSISSISEINTNEITSTKKNQNDVIISEKNIFENNQQLKTNNLLDKFSLNDEFKIINDSQLTTNKDDIVVGEKNSIIDDKNSSEKKVVSLDDKITIKDGSSIYVSSDNATQKKNGLRPYFSYNQERDVDMIVFNNNGSLVYADEQSEYDYCLKQEYDISCVRTSDGYYNGNDIIIVNDEGNQKVKVRVS